MEDEDEDEDCKKENNETDKTHQQLNNNNNNTNTNNNNNSKELVVPASMPNQSVVIESVNQMGIGEDELTGLLLASGGWDECQLELLDSLLDSL